MHSRLESTRSSWSELRRTPLVMRLYLLAIAVAALVLPFVLSGPVDVPHARGPVTGCVLVLVSVLNVEVGRWLVGGATDAPQPHKALSAWAFASAMLLPSWWLLLVVPITYAHARWRGIRLPLWKWVGSGFYLVLCGLAAGAVRRAFLGDGAHWSTGDGHLGALVMLLAVVVFLAMEALLFAGSAFLNDAEDEQWLRAMLSSPGFYATEAGVLLLGGLFAMVWAAAPWFTLFFVPVYILVQHAVLLAPMRERAAVATELSAKNGRLEVLNEALARSNAELDRGNEFKTDLMSMLGHELGNSVTAMLGYVEIGIEAVEAHDDDEARTALAVVQRNGQKVAVVLSDIVQLVASDRGVLTATPEPVALAASLEASIAGVPGHHRPEVECPEGLAVMVQPNHLDQILTNLLYNAEKYAGGATRVTAEAHPDGHVEVTVVDEGDGIPADLAAQLFERHRRGARTARTVGGSGLGLFISRELARANGGDLTHQPGHPRGSRFVVDLLAVTSEDASLTPAHAAE